MRVATDILREIAGGELVDELGDSIRDLNTAIEAAQKGGSITLKIDIKPAGRGSGALEVSYNITTKKPQLAARASIMFGTPEGDLLATDPRQQQLDLKSVSSDQPTTIKKVA
jgi:hypothetical protein